MNLMALLEYLDEELSKSASVPLTGKRLVDVEKCLDIVSELRVSLPDDVKDPFQIKGHKVSSRHRFRAVKGRKKTCNAGVTSLLYDTRGGLSRIPHHCKQENFASGRGFRPADTEARRPGKKERRTSAVLFAPCGRDAARSLRRKRGGC